MRNPDSRAHMLKADVIRDLEHVLEKPRLSFVRRRKVAVAALRAVSHVAHAIPGEEGLTKTRAWGDNRNGTSRNRFAGINRLHIAGHQDWHSPGDGLKIVDELNRLDVQIQLLSQRGVFNGPRQVGGLHASADHGTTYGKASAINRRLCLSKKLLHDGLKARIVGAVHPFLSD